MNARTEDEIRRKKKKENKKRSESLEEKSIYSITQFDRYLKFN